MADRTVVPHPHLRIALAIVAPFTLFIFVVALREIHVVRDTTSVIAGNLDSLLSYWGIYFVLWSALLFLAYSLQSSVSRHRSHLALSLSILGIALLARVATITLTTPQLSDDIWRYGFDGVIFAQGHNPYKQSPDEWPGESSRINHPWLVTAYQPASQWAFAALSIMKYSIEDALPPRLRELTHWRSYTFRAGFVVFDVAIIAIILLLLRLDNRSPWWACLYAWHPLAISEVAMSGHQDVIGIALLIASLAAVDRLIRGDIAEHLRPWVAALAGVTFAAAIGVKPIVIPLAVAIVYLLRRDRPAIIIGAASCLLMGAALYLPFLLMEGGMTRSFETALIFVKNWAFNSPIHAPLARVFVSKWLTNAVIWAAVVYLLYRLIKARLDLWSIAMWYLFLALLLSSTVHPWYLLWALALLPLRFNWALWIWSLTISWSYVALVSFSEYHVPWWVMLAEYGPVFAALAYGYFWRRRRGGAGLRLPSRDESTADNADNADALSRV